MKSGAGSVLTVARFTLLILLAAGPARAETSGPQDLRTQTCQAVFQIIVQCQASAEKTAESCADIAGVLSSSGTKESLRQGVPGDATTALVEETVRQVADMCSNACYRARGGHSYRTAQEWIDGGGCTIEVTP